MTKAIVMRTTGGPEVLKLETVEVGEPGVRRVVVKRDRSHRFDAVPQDGNGLPVGHDHGQILAAISIGVIK